MDDASWSSLKRNGQPHPFEEHVSQEEHLSIRTPRGYHVYYTHICSPSLSDAQLGAELTTELKVCSTLESLLPLLEFNLVEAILFDSRVPRQERRTVARWVRIFNPSVRCSETDEEFPQKEPRVRVA